MGKGRYWRKNDKKKFEKPPKLVLFSLQAFHVWSEEQLAATVFLRRTATALFLSVLSILWPSWSMQFRYICNVITRTKCFFKTLLQIYSPLLEKTKTIEWTARWSDIVHRQCAERKNHNSRAVKKNQTKPNGWSFTSHLLLTCSEVKLSSSSDVTETDHPIFNAIISTELLRHSPN